MNVLKTIRPDCICCILLDLELATVDSSHSGYEEDNCDCQIVWRFG